MLTVRNGSERCVWSVVDCVLPGKHTYALDGVTDEQLNARWKEVFDRYPETSK